MTQGVGSTPRTTPTTPVDGPQATGGSRADQLQAAADGGDWETTRSLLEGIHADAEAGNLSPQQRAQLADVLPQVQQKAEAADDDTVLKVILFILGIIPGIIALIVDAASTSDAEASADLAARLGSDQTDRVDSEQRPQRTDSGTAGPSAQPPAPTLDRAALTRAVQNARAADSTSGETITPDEARTLVASRGTGSVAQAREALAAMEMSDASRRNVESALTIASFQERLGSVPATLPPSATTTFNGEPVSKVRVRGSGGEWQDAGADLLRRMNAAKAALAENPPNVAAALRQFEGAPTASQIQINTGGAFESGHGITMARAFEAMGLGSEVGQAYAQLQVLSQMQEAIGHAPSMPPSEADLRAYGRSMRRSSPQELATAFEQYAKAFNVHVGTSRDIAYPEGASASAAIPPARNEVRADGRTVQDCDGFALLGNAFFSGGYRCQYVTTLLEGDSGGHRMLWVTKSGSNTGILVSNDGVTTGRARNRNDIIANELATVDGMAGQPFTQHLSARFSNDDPR